MAGTPTPIFPQTVKNWFARLLPATGAYTIPSTASTTVTALVALVVGDVNGDKVESLTITSTDTAAQALVLMLVTASDSFCLGVVNIPLTSGTVTAVAPIDVLRSPVFAGLPFDANGNKYIYVPSGATLYLGTLTAVTAAKSIVAVASGGQF